MLKQFTKKTLFFINKNPISKVLYQNEISNRAKLPIMEIDLLSKPINLFSPYTNEVHPPNDWYSHAKIFKKFLGLDEKYQFKFVIEHGSFLTPLMSPPEMESPFSIIVTSNKFRAKILKKYKDYSFSVGPFIHYAKNFYTKAQIIAEKERLGKNILVFPGHSAVHHIQKFDNEWFIKEIKKIAKDFDSIRICLYWSDIQLGFHKYYQNLGFECITAGHIIDPNFLPRLKGIIEIADLTMSNDIGTHIGFSVFMDKPHILFHRFPRLQANRKWERELTIRHWQSKPFQEILDSFAKVSYKITPKQRSIANKYYGGRNDLRNKKEFKKIVDFSEKIYQQKLNSSPAAINH